MKNNKQIIKEIQSQLNQNNFKEYNLKDTMGFFSENYEFLERNQLFLVPIFNDLSYDLKVIKLSDLYKYSMHRDGDANKNIFPSVEVNKYRKETVELIVERREKELYKHEEEMILKPYNEMDIPEVLDYPDKQRGLISKFKM